MKWTNLTLVIVAASWGVGWSGAIAAPAYRTPQRSPLCAAEDPNWEQQIWEVMREIYRALAGHLLDSPSTNTNTAMQQVMTAFQEDGFRTDLTANQVSKLLTDLDAIDSMLEGDIPEGVDTGIVGDFLDLIPAMRAALTGGG